MTIKIVGSKNYQLLFELKFKLSIRESERDVKHHVVGVEMLGLNV